MNPTQIEQLRSKAQIKSNLITKKLYFPNHNNTMDLTLRPSWVAEAIWNNMTPKEKVYCILRTRNATDSEIMDWLKIKCDRTYRYFKAKMRNLLFSK